MNLDTMFSLPTSTMTGITSVASSMFSDFLTIMVVVLGIPLLFWIISIIRSKISGNPEDELGEEDL
jgi:hypothetical protein